MSMSSMLPRHIRQENFRPGMLNALIIIHAGALLAPFTFSWPGFIAFAVMAFATGCLGITLCYHRMLSHRSFRAVKPVKYFLMLCGALSMEGAPTWWVATHRLHHRESDQELDPHSPTVSFLWAHMLWLLYEDPRLDDERILKKFVPDLEGDPFARFLEKYFLQVNLGFLALLTAIGFALGGMKMGMSMLVWGGFLRIVYAWHITWFVNSVTHIWGYRNYETRDQSRNLWWVALLTFGEGWHNNHHAHPAAAKSGHRWWEFDLTYGIIQMLRILGLASKVIPLTEKKAPAAVGIMPTTGLRHAER